MRYEDEILERVRNGSIEGHRYWTFVLEYDDCASCGRHMLPNIFKDRPYHKPYLFPVYNEINSEKQREAAGFVWRSGETLNGDAICEECADAGKASFRCEFCGETRASNLRYDEYPSDTCLVCAETLSKKEWEERQDQWEDDHKYDNYP